MKQNRFGFPALQTAVLACTLVLGTNAVSATIDVDADGGATFVVNGGATVNSQSLAVGTDNSNNSLVITNAGMLIVDTTTVGSTGFGDNTVLVTGSNSYLQARSSLNIGTASGSTGNQLNVEDNGWVFVGDLNGNLPSGSGISVGSTNAPASLAIGSGSQVEAGSLLVGTQSNAVGAVSLTGPDTTLALSNDLLLGTGSSGNTLNATNGVMISVSNNLLLGTGGSGNALSVGNGSTLTVDNDLLIGSTNTVNNQLTVNSGGAVVVLGTTTIENGTTNAINVKSGGSLTMSQGFDLDDKTNGFNIDGGASLELGGTVAANTMDYNLDITLTGAGTTWTTTTNNNTIVGGTVDGNSLTLKDGASLTNATGGKLYVGKDSDLNKLVVSGTKSFLLVDQNKETIVGATGAGNTLTVESNAVAHLTGTVKVGNTTSDNAININSGGQLRADNDIIVGVQGSTNEFNIDGGQMTVGGDFVLGDKSNNNRYNQINGTATIDGSFILGQTADADGITYAYADTANRAFVGSNSTMEIHQDLIAGKGGNGNTFSIRDGGVATVDGDAIIGQSSDDNYIFLMEEGGTNNLLNVTGDLVVGMDGGDNRFSIYGGTANIAGNVLLGASTNQYDANYIHLATTNAVLNIAKALNVGTSNSANFVRLAAGATINTHDLFVGICDGVSNNTVTISGEDYGEITPGQYGWLGHVADSLVYVTNSLVIGNTNGTGNAVVVRNGGILNVDQAGIVINGTNNTLNIANGGTLQSTDWDMSAMDTNIIMDSGSTLELGGTLTGTDRLDNPFALVLNGASALWNTGTNSLYIGYTNDNNTLTVENGAKAATDADLIIGNSDESTGNQLTATEAGSLVNVGNNLIIGQDGSSGNTLSVDDGAQVNVTNNLIIGSGSGAVDNLLELSSNATANVYGIATIGQDADNNIIGVGGTNAVLNAYSNLVIGAGNASGNQLVIMEGSVMVSNNLVIGQDKDSTGNSATVSGSNSTLHVLDNLYVGKDGGNNSINVTNGAQLEAMNAYIGYASGNNNIEVHGSNTAFNVLNDLFIGNTASSGENSLSVSDGAQVTVANNLSLKKGTLYIYEDSQVGVGGNYSQDALSTLVLGVGANTTTTNLVVGRTASFANNTSIKIKGDQTKIGTTNKIARALVAANALKIGGQTATQDLLNDYINISNDLLDFNLIVSNNIIWIDNITRLSLAQTSGLQTGSQLANIANAIDAMALSSNQLAVAMRDFMDTEQNAAERNAAFNNYYGEKASSTPGHNAINMGVQSVAEQLTKRADNTRIRMGSASTGMNAPEGAQGPYMKDQELQGWVTGFKTWADRSADSGFDGYDGNVNGFLIGADLAVADGILVGVAGGSASSTMDKDNGASTDTDTKFGTVYASTEVKDWFIDSSLIYGSSSIDNELGTTFDTKSKYDAQNIAVYLGGGKEIVGTYLIFTPQASLLGNYYSQDGYNETSTTAVARKVDSFDNFYLQGAVGCNVGFYSSIGNLTLKPEFRAFWLHEFNAKEEDLAFSLIGGSGESYNMQLQAPESDIFKLGAGVSAKLGEYLELRADLDARMANSYSDYTLLGTLRYQF